MRPKTGLANALVIQRSGDPRFDYDALKALRQANRQGLPEPEFDAAFTETIVATFKPGDLQIQAQP